MGSFKEFFENDKFVDLILEEFNNNNTSVIKPWSASKKEILSLWRQLRPDLPIYLVPMAKIDNMSHSSYSEDGIRITGSWAFISSILGRLKELLQFENPSSKLRLVFRGIEMSRLVRPDRQSFVFYLNLETRKKKGPRQGPTI